MKSKKILIILIIVILALGATVMAFFYTTTDFLKTDRQLFASYFSQIEENIDSFKSEELENYFDKTNHTPYENEGKLLVSVQNDRIPEKNLSAINDFNITFSGKTDKEQKQVNQSININYSNDVSFPIEYIQTGNQYGISSDLLLKKYITVDTKNFQEFLTKMNSEDANITGILEEDISKEELVQLFQKAKTILAENLSEGNYTKVSEETITLTISEKEAVTIATKLLQEVKNCSFVTEEQMSQIDDQIAELQEIQATTAELMKITVNQKGTMIVTIENIGTIQMQTSPNMVEIKIMPEEAETDVTIKINKLVRDNLIAYQIDTTLFEGETEIKILLQAQYTNLNLESAEEKYLLSLDITEADETVTYDYTLDVTKKFVSRVITTPLGIENSVLLNNMTETYITTLMGRLTEGIIAINKMQMESLGLSESENPIVYATPFGSMFYQTTPIEGVAGENVPNENNQTLTGN